MKNAAYLLLAFVLSACYQRPITYQSQMVVLTDVEKQGEWSASATGALSHMETQVQLALIDNVFITAQGMGGIRGWSYSFGGGALIEGKNVKAVVGGGYGKGAIVQEHRPLCFFSKNPMCMSYDSDVQFTRPYIQSEVHFDLDEKINFGLLYRHSFTHFNHYRFVENVSETEPQQSIVFDLERNNIDYGDISLFIDAKLSYKTKLQISVGLINENSTFQDHSPIHRDVYANVILRLEMNRKKTQESN